MRLNSDFDEFSNFDPKVRISLMLLEINLKIFSEESALTSDLGPSDTIFKMAILKIVSDGPKSDVRALSSEKIFKLISNNIKEILTLGSKLENSSKSEFKRITPPNICDQIKKTWHFTVSQEHQLNMLVRRWLAVFPESTLLSTIKDEKNSKSVIALLSISLGKHEVDWDLT